MKTAKDKVRGVLILFRWLHKPPTNSGTGSFRATIKHDKLGVFKDYQDFTATGLMTISEYRDGSALIGCGAGAARVTYYVEQYPKGEF